MLTASVAPALHALAELLKDHHAVRGKMTSVVLREQPSRKLAFLARAVA